MASTNKTTNLELSQYVSSDKPTYLVDYNSDMSKIDTGVHTAQVTADSASTAATNAQATAEGAQTTANTAITNAAAAQTSADTAITNIGTLANLDTATKTSTVAAINEVVGKIGNLSNLDTTIKSDLVNAINEIITPAGTILPYAGSVAPDGYLMADGSNVSRTTYANLFSVIGTTYGVGDGSNTFTLPNLVGKVIVGLNSNDTDFNALGKTGGSKTNKLTPKNYEFNNWMSEGFPDQDVNTYIDGGSSMGIHTRTISNDNEPVNNLQPYVVLNYIIKI